MGYRSATVGFSAVQAMPYNLGLAMPLGAVAVLQDA
jgi:hypothetical protein